MTYEMYRYIFLGGLIACAVFFVIAVVLFFVLRIPQVISDLTGRTARKAIENIRLQNEWSGDKTYQSDAVQIRRIKQSDKKAQSNRQVPGKAMSFDADETAEMIVTQSMDTEEPAGETTVLMVSEETVMLETKVGATEELPVPVVQVFTVEFEITYIHTNETIE